MGTGHGPMSSVLGKETASGAGWGANCARCGSGLLASLSRSARGTPGASRGTGSESEEWVLGHRNQESQGCAGHCAACPESRPGSEPARPLWVPPQSLGAPVTSRPLLSPGPVLPTTRSGWGAESYSPFSGIRAGRGGWWWLELSLPLPPTLRQNPILF